MTANGLTTRPPVRVNSRPRLATAASLAFAMLTVSACGGSGGGGSSDAAGGSSSPPPAISLTLTAGPLSVASGGRSTLTWSTTSAASCEASGGWTGARATTGSEQTPPLTATTTFTLSCSGASGQVSRSATIEVSGATAPALSLAADPGTVVAGGRATLTWSSTGATSCEASGGWTGARATAGSVQTDPLAGTTTYTLTCSGAGGQVSRSASVNVSSPTAFVVGGTVAGLTGSMTLQINGASGLVVSANGPFVFPIPLANSAAYAVTIAQQPSGLTCAIANGSGTIAGANVSNVRITCGSVPQPNVTIEASPSTVAPNGTTNLTWSSTNATSCEAQGSWAGPRPTSGSETVGPLALTTNFALFCTGPGGTNLGVVTVEVSRPPTLSLTSLSETVNAGREGTVFWRTTGVTSCVASGGWSGTRAANGDERVAVPSRRADFTLRCDGPGGSVTEKVSIRRNALCQRPEMAISMTPASVAPGGSSTLDWYTGNATQCTASGGWSGTKMLMGSETVGPLASDTTFALTCDGDVGRTVYARRVGINRQAPSIYFQARYSEADPQSTAGNVLVWSVENATSCAASGGWSGGKVLSGSQTIPNVTSPTTFGLNCTGNGTTTEAQLSVTPLTRTNLPPIARPDVVDLDEGQPFTLLDLGEAYFANDEDPDGCVADFSHIAKNSWGVWMTTYFEPDDERMWFRALDDLTGDLREYYAVYDSHGRRSDNSVATLRIAGSSDALQLEPDRAAVIAGSGPVFISITANDRGTDQRASVNVSRAPTNGSVSLGLSGVGPDAPYVIHYHFARYTPRTGFTGTDTFDYEVVNADGQRASTTVTIDVRSNACTADGTLTAPLAGTAGVDWRAIQFPDVRSAAGQAADARGGPFVHDQGRRTDFLVGDLDDTYRPIPVRAMQCGRVIAAADTQFTDNTPSSTIPVAALLACGNYIQMERHDGTRDLYCNLRYGSGGPPVGTVVMEGQYLGRAGYTGGFPGLRVEITAPDGQLVDLLSAPGTFDLAYPTTPEILAFGVTTTDDPRSRVSPAILRPQSSASIDRDATPVLWYRVYGAPSTTQRRLSIQDGQGTRVWQAQFGETSSPAGVFAYIAESTATRTDLPTLPRLPPGTYTAILELPSFPSVSARTTFSVAN